MQSVAEKKFKAKETQESYVVKAREKYDADCQRIQTYTQQCASAQGKELERAQTRLHRAQQTGQANEMDLQRFTQDLLNMLPQWEKDWKDFCDECQDMEEDRLEALKDILWTYANEVSTLCVYDDQVRMFLILVGPFYNNVAISLVKIFVRNWINSKPNATSNTL